MDAHIEETMRKEVIQGSKTGDADSEGKEVDELADIFHKHWESRIS